MIEKAKFIYPPLGKTLEKQIKATEDQGNKLKPSLKSFKIKVK